MTPQSAPRAAPPAPEATGGREHFMDETRAIATLPHLEIEIRHRRLPEEQAEQLAISLRATPSFAAFAEFLERQALWPWLALQPWLLSARMIQASWQPWLAVLGAASAAHAQPVPVPDPPDRS
jgi:hypothetical protein